MNILRLKISSILVCVVLSYALCISANCYAEDPVDPGSYDNTQDEKKLFFSMQDCIIYAVRNSLDVGIAKVDYLIQGTQERSAESIFDAYMYGLIGYEENRMENISILYPDKLQTNTYELGAKKKLPTGTDLDFSYSTVRSWNNSQYNTYNPAFDSEFTLDITQPVLKNFFGYNDRRTVTLAKLAVKNADLSSKDQIEAIIAGVEKYYWVWLFEMYTFNMFKEMLEKAESLDEINKKNFNIGRIEKGDLYASEANVITRRNQVKLSKNRVKRSEENLKLAMNLPENIDLETGDKLEVTSAKITLVGCLQEAFNNRRDYKIAKRDIEINNIDLQMKSNQLWPEVDLVGTIGANGVDTKLRKSLRNITDNNNMDFYAGIDISIPLENNLAVSNYNKAKYEKERAILSFKNVERTIVTEIGNAYRNYTTYQANLNGLREARDLEDLKLKEEEKRFSYGRSNTKRVIDYQSDLLLSQIRVASGILDLENSRVELERQMNILLKQYEEYL